METTTKSVGRRKASVARVLAARGTGKITVNKKDYTDYFPVLHLRHYVELPFKTLSLAGEYDFVINVQGGGIKGQAEAVKLGISRALVKLNPEFRPALKAQKLLTRDARVVERKKPGLKKARKSDQFSKR